MYIFFSSFLLEAQTDIVRFRNLDTQNGLSNDWVNSIAEDSRGFMWIATRSGLNIYDGTQNQILNHEPSDINSLSIKDVSEVIYSKHDVIVAGTWGGGVHIIDPYSKEIKQAGRKIVDRQMTVKSIVETSDTILWIGTYGDGLYKYDVDDKDFVKCRFTEKYGLPEKALDYCQDISVVNDTVWISFSYGVLGYVSPGDTVISLAQDREGNTLNLGKVISSTSYENNLILGTQTGEVFFYDINSKELSLIYRVKQKSRVNGLMIDENKQLWISAISDIYKYDFETEKGTRMIPPDGGKDYNNNYVAFNDSRGVKWFGTWGNGLNWYSESFNKFRHIHLSNKNSTAINAVLPLNDSLLLFATTSGLYQYHKYTTHSHKVILKGEYAKEVQNGIMLALVPFRDKILVGIDGFGLLLMDENYNVTGINENKELRFSNTTIAGVNKLKNGEIWIGSWSKGVAVINERTNEYHEYRHLENDSNSLGSNTVFCAATDQDGETWIGTQGGLFRYNYNTKSFKKEAVYVSLDGEPVEIQNVKDIIARGPNSFWLATSEGVINYNYLNKSVKQLSDKDGLIDNIIHSIIIVKNELWASTISGLIKIDLTDDAVTNYTTKDGLNSNTFNNHSTYLPGEGNLYCGNGNGVLYFNPSELVQKKSHANFFFQKLFLDDTLVTSDFDFFSTHISKCDSIKLDYSQNNIGFEIAIQDYGESQGGQYAYKLLGFEKNWVVRDYNHRLIRYTNLDPGEYVFQLSNISEDGDLSGEITELHLIIKKPFWLNVWFICLAILMGLLLIYLVFLFRLRTIKQRNKLLELKVDRRTKEINTQNSELRLQRESMQSNLRYASLLQSSLLPKSDEIVKGFDTHFIYNAPKDVVSGDFYWFTKVGTKNIFIVADCIGHGVSGAFISVLGITSLKTIIEVKGIVRPDLILNQLHSEITHSLQKYENGIKDGMDISIVCFDKTTKKLEVASAMSSVLIINDQGSAKMIQGDRLPVGGDPGVYPSFNYRLEVVDVKEKSHVYLYSDGYKDQFGGPEGKKYMYTNFKNLLVQLPKYKIEDREGVLRKEFLAWKGEEEQVDDVLVVGLELE